MTDDITRRALFRRAGRYAGACALAGVTGYLGLRAARQGAFFSGSASSVCRRCGALESCRLPEAARTRLALAERSDVRLARREASRDETACPYGQGEDDDPKRTKSDGLGGENART